MILTELIKEALEMPSKKFERAPRPICTAAEIGAVWKMLGWLCAGNAALNALAWSVTEHANAARYATLSAKSVAVAYSIGILLYNGYAKNAMWYHTRKSESK